MRRRDFIAGLGGTAVWPLTARAQQPVLPIIGFLNARSPNDTVGLAAAFRQGLNEAGFVDGRNITIEYRWASNQADQLPALVSELVRRPVAVIAAFSTAAAHAAKAHPTTIPVVFMTGDDPIKAGIVTSMSRPSGNVTGVTFAAAILGAKRLQLLRALAPKADLIALLVDPIATESVNQAADVEAAARTLAQKLVVLRAGTTNEIDASIASLTQQGAGALLVAGSPRFLTRREEINALVARQRIPAMYNTREYISTNGLISYGASTLEAYRQTGLYVARVLRGDKPSDLPVMQPTRFELVINLKTAKALGIEIPLTLVALADEVIE